MVFYWSLRDNKSLQVSRILFSPLADFNNAVVWMISARPLISNSSSPFINPKVTVPSAPITTGITITFMCHNSFSLLQQGSGTYLSFRSFSILPSGHLERESPLLDILSCCCCCCCLSLYLVVWLILGDPFVSQNPWWFCTSHFSGRVLCCTYRICSYGQMLASFTIPSGLPYAPTHV